jgi:hypothetical protein
MTIFNYLTDNDIFFFGIFIGVTCHLGLSFLSSTWHGTKGYTDTGVQTDTWEDKSSLIQATSEVGTQTIAGDIDTVTTVLPVQPVNIEIVPNPDIVGRVIDQSSAEYIAAKADQLNALDPFLATAWTPERVSSVIDHLSVINNLWN